MTFVEMYGLREICMATGMSWDQNKTKPKNADRILNLTILTPIKISTSYKFEIRLTPETLFPYFRHPTALSAIRWPYHRYHTQPAASSIWSPKHL